MRKRFRPTLGWIIHHMTLDCVIFTQFSVIRIIHRNVGLKYFFYLLKCLSVIIVTHAYFTHVSQGSVETHLWHGGIYNKCIIANCLQSVSVKEFWKSIINWRRYGQKQNATFFMAHHVYYIAVLEGEIWTRRLSDHAASKSRWSKR